MQTLYLFLISLITTFIIDMVWLGYLAKNLYQTSLQSFLRIENGELQPIWWAAGIVYAAIALGIVTFVLPKANGSVFHALLAGGLFGLTAYAIYDFTNYSTLANWPLTITLIDTLWGMVLCALTSAITLLIARLFTS